jgi:hypothetical protein
MWGLSDRLRSAAEQILTAVDANDPKTAQQYIRSEERRFDSTVQKLNRKLAKLTDLKGDFIRMSGAL